MRRKRRYVDRIQPLSFEKTSLFKNPFFWIVAVVVLVLGILVY